MVSLDLLGREYMTDILVAFVHLCFGVVSLFECDKSGVRLLIFIIFILGWICHKTYLRLGKEVEECYDKVRRASRRLNIVPVEQRAIFPADRQQNDSKLSRLMQTISKNRIIICKHLCRLVVMLSLIPVSEISSVEAQLIGWLWDLSITTWLIHRKLKQVRQAFVELENIFMSRGFNLEEFIGDRPPQAA